METNKLCIVGGAAGPGAGDRNSNSSRRRLPAAIRERRREERPVSSAQCAQVHVAKCREYDWIFKFAGFGIAAAREGDRAAMFGGQRAGQTLRQDSAEGLARQSRLGLALRVPIEWDDDIIRVVCRLILLGSMLSGFLGQKVRRLVHERQDIRPLAGERRLAFSERGQFRGYFANARRGSRSARLSLRAAVRDQ